MQRAHTADATRVLFSPLPVPALNAPVSYYPPSAPFTRSQAPDHSNGFDISDGLSSGFPPSLPPSLPPNGAPTNGGPLAHLPQPTGPESAKPRRPGDWDCPACQAVVFGSKLRCFKCAAPRPQGLEAMPWPRQTPSRRPGDWDCPNPSCRALVFASKTACFRCGTPPAPHQMHGYGMMSGGGMMGYGGGYVMGPMGGGGGSAQAMMGGMTYGMAMGGMHQAYPSYGMGGGPMAQGAMAAAYGMASNAQGIGGGGQGQQQQHSMGAQQQQAAMGGQQQYSAAAMQQQMPPSPPRRWRAKEWKLRGARRGRLLRLLP